MSAGPVTSWVQEMKYAHESECTTMLQSKPIKTKRLTKEVFYEPSANINHKIKDVQEKAAIISGLFADLIR